MRLEYLKRLSVDIVPNNHSRRSVGSFGRLRSGLVCFLIAISGLVLVSCGKEPLPSVSKGPEKTDSTKGPDWGFSIPVDKVTVVRHPLLNRGGTRAVSVFYEPEVTEYTSWCRVFEDQGYSYENPPDMDVYEWMPTFPLAEGSDIKVETEGGVLTRVYSREELDASSYMIEKREGITVVLMGVPNPPTFVQANTNVFFKYRIGAVRLEDVPLFGGWEKATEGMPPDDGNWWMRKLYPAPIQCEKDEEEFTFVHLCGEKVRGEDWDFMGDCLYVRFPPDVGESSMPSGVGISYFAGSEGLENAPVEEGRSEDESVDVVKNLLFRKPSAKKCVRPALYLPTPCEVHVPVAIPDNGRLFFAIAPPFCPEAVGSVVYRVSAYVEGAEAEEKVLFEEEMEIRRENDRGWEGRNVSTSDFAGRDVVLCFSTTAKTSYRWSIPAYIGSPTVYADRGSTKPNVVLVAFDTQRADHLGCYGYERDTSPNVDLLAEEGMRFDACFSPSAWTLPSFVGAFTGRFPRTFGFVDENFALPRTTPTLARVLREHGYHTVGVVSNYMLHPHSNLDVGFDTYDLPADYLNGDGAMRTTDAALERLAEPLPEPFFLFVHYMDPHMPIGMNDESINRYTKGYDGPLKPGFADSEGSLYSDPDDRQYLIDLYDGDCRYTDKEFGRLMNRIKELDSTGNTITVFMADHGEEYWDHGVGMPLNFGCDEYERGLGHCHTYYREIVRTPLIVRYPKAAEAGTVCSDPVSLLDIAPTILDLAGIDPDLLSTERDPIQGVSLMRTLQNGDKPPKRTLYFDSYLLGEPRLGILEYPWKMVHNLKTGQSILFDLSVDPYERNNLLPREWKKAESMLDGILQYNRDVCRQARIQILELRAVGDGVKRDFRCVLTSSQEIPAAALGIGATPKRYEKDGKRVCEIVFSSDKPLNRIVLMLGNLDVPIECVLEIDGKADPAKVFCGPSSDSPSEFPFRADLLPTGFAKPVETTPAPGWGVWMIRDYRELSGPPRGETAEIDNEGRRGLRALHYIGDGNGT